MLDHVGSGLPGAQYMAKSNGKSGQPCLLLFEIVKGGEAAKGVFIEAEGAAYKCLIALRNGPRKAQMFKGCKHERPAKPIEGLYTI